jgi:hypothetical protein
MPRERFFVEVAPGYLRLRHQLGLRSKFGRGRLSWLEVDQDVWHQLDRRLTLLDAMRKRARGRPLSEEAKKRKHWQGLTVGGLGPDEYGKLYARSYEAAVRKRERMSRTETQGSEVTNGRPDRTLAAGRPQGGEAAPIS